MQNFKISAQIVAHNCNTFEPLSMVSATRPHQYVDDIQNVLDIGFLAGRTCRTNDGESVAVATNVVTEVDAICWAAKRNAIICVINDVVLD